MTFRSRTRTPIEKQLAAIVERLAAAEPENQHLIPPDWAGSDQRVRLEGFQHVLTARYSQLEPRWASALAGGGGGSGVPPPRRQVRPHCGCTTGGGNQALEGSSSHATVLKTQPRPRPAEQKDAQGSGRASYDKSPKSAGNHGNEQQHQSDDTLARFHQPLCSFLL